MKKVPEARHPSEKDGASGPNSFEVIDPSYSEMQKTINDGRGSRQSKKRVDSFFVLPPFLLLRGRAEPHGTFAHNVKDRL